jgi:uncharacterized protein
MNLKEQIQDDMKNAMRAKEAQRLSAIRLILAAIKQYEVDKRAEVDDAVALSILDKMLKQRRDSIEQYQKANRQDLVDQETFEVNVIQTYLPAQLSEAEISALVKAAITASGASSAKDMGKVMAELKPKLQGRADMAMVGAKVKEHLG